jgi:pyocin large subunit-like protein
VTVGTQTISSSAAVVVAASLCAAAALYYRKKRRRGVIDLEKEENLVQGDFVELSKTGVSV